MTNERAIELLRRLQDEQFDGVHGDERREALEMAIRAMEEPKTAGSGSLDSEQPEIKTDRTTGDCINRQQAIDAVRNAKFYFRIKPEAYLRDAGDAVNEIVCQVSEAYVKALLDVPPAERPQFWIDSEGKLSALPSAQPNVHDPEKDADCISRQQAIEAFEPTHYTDWYTPTIIKTLAELPQAQQDKLCKGCHFEKHGSRACDHCSRMYMDRYEVRTYD